MNLTAWTPILSALQGLTLHDPMPYLEMQRLQMSARVNPTDSSGHQHALRSSSGCS
jgi:hypothetical protein